MKDLMNTIFYIALIITAICFQGWKADWQIKCMFDYSPKACARIGDLK